jgi:hypothetical protein
MTHNLGLWRDLSFLDWQVHYCKKRARMAFDVHCKHHQCLYKVLSSFERGLSTDQSKHVVVGYGQAKVAATAGKELAVHTTEVFHVCCKSWPTKLIDEFRIDIYCYNCEERLKMGNKEDGKTTGVCFSVSRMLANLYVH